MSKPWPCRNCRRDVCADCAVEPSPCEHDDLCMDCWDTCGECHAADVTDEDAAYTNRVRAQMAAFAAVAARPRPEPGRNPLDAAPTTDPGHRRTEILRAAYSQQRAECACGWAGDWHYYNEGRLVEDDWAAHLEEVA